MALGVLQHAGRVKAGRRAGGRGDAGSSRHFGTFSSTRIAHRHGWG